VSPNTGRTGWRRYATIGTVAVAFLLSGAFASFAVWYAWQKDRDTARNQILTTCLNGGEFRILVAQSNDRIRLALISLAADQESPQVKRFLKATQPAIDDFLSQAAGETYRAPRTGKTPGEVTDTVVEEVRRLSAKRCDRRSVAADVPRVTSPR
jgi:hypothetical protein